MTASTGPRGAASAQPFAFERNGLTLRGTIDLPDGPPIAGVLLVPGHGETCARSGMFSDLRARFTAAGLACCVWDRLGCGDSDGTYDHYQSAADSGVEAAAAYQAFARQTGLPPTRIGWWGISRAGWICPYAMRDTPPAAFWISVSGGGERDNFPYLVRTNLRLAGHSADETEALIGEFAAAMRALQSGADHEAFLAAMPNLGREPFLIKLGFPWPRDLYERVRDRHVSGAHRWDDDAEAARAAEFRAALATLRCPTLGIFGERDLFVDWRDTARLYQEAFAASGTSDLLTIRSFPEADHGLYRCDTGSVMELMTRPANGWHHVDGFVDAMIAWLSELGMARA